MIYVFKTLVKTKMQAKKLKPHIDRILRNAKWNFTLMTATRYYVSTAKKTSF